MFWNLTIIRATSLALILFLAPTPAFAGVLTRPALMTLAHDFVARLGQKLQPLNESERAMNRIPDDELLLFRPRLAREIVIDGEISTIKKNRLLFFSLREFSQTLYLPIRVSPETLSAQGWFIQEKNTFTMDLNQKFVQSRGQRFDVTEDEWFRQDGDLFISAKSIEKWMGIISEPNWDVLLLDMASAEPFPIEERNLRRKRKLNEQNVVIGPQLPRIEHDYKTATVPNADISITHAVRKDGGETSQYTRTHTVQSAGDLMGHTVRSFLTGNNRENIDNFRFQAEKRSEESDLLGNLKARQYTFGDIQPTALSLSGSSEQELGFRATNSEEGLSTGETTRTFEGDVPPDWDVELYNDAQLIAFQTVGTDGRYSFPNVDLFSGDNNFHLIFYGPQGEIREEDINIPIDIADIGRDGSLYDVSLTMSGTQTYQKNPEKDVDMNTPHLVVKFDRGIADGLSVNGGARIRQVQEKYRAIGNVGGVIRLGKTLLNANLATDEDLESSLQIVARRPFGKQDLRASVSFESSKYDPENTGTEATSFDGNVALRGPIVELFGYRLSYDTTGRYSESAKNGNRMSARAALNAQAGRLNIGQSVDFQRFNNANNPFQDVFTTTSFRTNMGQTRVRGGWVYRLFPDNEWDSVFLDLNRKLTKHTQARLELTRDIKPDKTEAAASLNWSTDHFVLSPRVSYDSTHDLRATLNMRFGLAYDPYARELNMRRENMTSQGAVHAFVFLDKDGNNKFDGDDEPLPAARVLSVQLNRSAQTDDKGHAFIANLPEYEPTDIVVDVASLDDPYFVSGFEGRSVYPRPGSPDSLDFPIHLSGEIDGYVYKYSESRTPEAASGLTVYMINEKGETAFSSLTAFDGYYVISTVPPGRYLLMVEPNDLDKSGYRQPLPRTVSIGYDGKVLSEQNIQLEKGGEVPLTFALTRKGAEAPENIIKAEFGSYRSELLATVVKLRLLLALRSDNLKPVIQIQPVRINQAKIEHKLVSTFGPRQFTRARDVCATLIGRGLTCRLNIPPALLLEPNVTSTPARKDQG